MCVNIFFKASYFLITNKNCVPLKVLNTLLLLLYYIYTILPNIGGGGLRIKVVHNLFLADIILFKFPHLDVGLSGLGELVRILDLREDINIKKQLY